MTKTTQHLPLLSLFHYGLIALPVAFAGFPIYLLAPDFYATQFGLSLTSLATVLLVLRFIDGIQDPFIGAFSDKFHHVRPLIIIGSAIALILAFWFLFQPLTNSEYLLWFAASIFVITTAYSILVINVTAIGGIWASNTHDRTRIAMVREVCGVLGLLVGVLLPSLLKETMPLSNAFAFMSAILFALMFIGLFLFLSWYFLNLDDIQPKQQKEYRIAFLKSWFEMPGETKSFFFIYGLNILAASIPAILVIFFVRDFLQAPSYIGLFLALYFLSGVIGMIGWSFLSRHWDDKYKTWCYAMGLSVLSFVWALFLQPGELIAFGVICVISGLGFGADLSLPPSILADHISSHQRRSESGFYHAQMTLLTKLSLALSTAVVFPILDAAGFKPSQENDSDALFILVICYALIPCLIKAVSIALLVRHAFFLKFKGGV